MTTLYRFPKWLLRRPFEVGFLPGARNRRFAVTLPGVSTGFGASIAEAAKNARGARNREQARLRERGRHYKTPSGAPCLRKTRDKKRGGSLVAAVRYSI